MVTHEKDTAPIEEQVKELASNVLECRDMRHAWAVDVPYQRITFVGGPRGAVYLERTLGCMRGCGCVRVEVYRVYRNRLERLSSSLKYPKEGYHLHGVKRGESVVEIVRREQVRRVLGLE